VHRGRGRRDRRNWGPDTTVVRGQLPPGKFDFSGPPGRHVWLRGYAFDEVKANGTEFDLDEVHLFILWSEFVNCVFRQRAKPLGDPRPQGDLGWRPTTFRGCTFERVQFRIRGGFDVGQARFEDCLFRHCRFHEHFSHCADYVNCTFEGTISMAVFFGRDTGDWCRGKRNEFRGNDFRKAKLQSVDFRKGIRVDEQLWPEGYQPIVDVP
jgi:uncharacterized protein YjbI with pentapeptide repeats